MLLAFAPTAGAAKQELTIPAGISTKESLLSQFGYAPDYQRHVVTFDAANWPIVRSRTASQDDTDYAAFLEDGVWRHAGFYRALRAVYSDFAGYMGAGGFASDRVVTDASGRVYTALTIRLGEGEFRNVLLYSRDRGVTWGVAELPFGEEQPNMDNANRGNLACEAPAGGRTIEGPPFIAVWREIADWPGAYATRNELWVTQPRWEGDHVVVPEPVLVTSRFLGMIQSAGGTSFATTVGGKTYFVWTQVCKKRTRGTPTYVGVYEHETHSVTQRVRAAFGHPANDCHCTPALAIDSAGVLHLVAGAHARPFRYTYSVRPLDISAWAPEVKVLDSGYWTKGTGHGGMGKQAYASLVCTPDDALHLVFRQTRRFRGGRFPKMAYCALCYQTRPAGGPWSKVRMLAYPVAGPGYTNFFQKLTLDRDGRLYLSFSVYRHSDSPVIYRRLQRFRYRMLWWSDDGHSWAFATTETFNSNAAATDSTALVGAEPSR